MYFLAQSPSSPQFVEARYYNEAVYRNIMDMLATLERTADQAANELRDNLLSITFPDQQASAWAINQGTPMPPRKEWAWASFVAHNVFGFDFITKGHTVGHPFVYPGLFNGYGGINWNDYAGMLNHKFPANTGNPAKYWNWTAWPMPTDPVRSADEALRRTRAHAQDVLTIVRALEWELTRVRLPGLEGLRAAAEELLNWAFKLPLQVIALVPPPPPPDPELRAAVVKVGKANVIGFVDFVGVAVPAFISWQSFRRFVSWAQEMRARVLEAITGSREAAAALEEAERAQAEAERLAREAAAAAAEAQSLRALVEEAAAAAKVQGRASVRDQLVLQSAQAARDAEAKAQAAQALSAQAEAAAARARELAALGAALVDRRSEAVETWRAAEAAARQAAESSGAAMNAAAIARDAAQLLAKALPVVLPADTASAPAPQVNASGAPALPVSPEQVAEAINWGRLALVMLPMLFSAFRRGG